MEAPLLHIFHNDGNGKRFEYARKDTRNKKIVGLKERPPEKILKKKIEMNRNCVYIVFSLLTKINFFFFVELNRFYFVFMRVREIEKKNADHFVSHVLCIQVYCIFIVQ